MSDFTSSTAQLGEAEALKYNLPVNRDATRIMEGFMKRDLAGKAAKDKANKDQLAKFHDFKIDGKYLPMYGKAIADGQAQVINNYERYLTENPQTAYNRIMPEWNAFLAKKNVLDYANERGQEYIANPKNNLREDNVAKLLASSNNIKDLEQLKNYESFGITGAQDGTFDFKDVPDVGVKAVFGDIDYQGWQPTGNKVSRAGHSFEEYQNAVSPIAEAREVALQQQIPQLKQSMKYKILHDAEKIKGYNLDLSSPTFHKDLDAAVNTEIAKSVHDQLPPAHLKTEAVALPQPTAGERNPVKAVVSAQTASEPSTAMTIGESHPFRYDASVDRTVGGLKRGDVAANRMKEKGYVPPTEEVKQAFPVGKTTIMSEGRVSMPKVEISHSPGTVVNLSKGHSELHNGAANYVTGDAEKTFYVEGRRGEIQPMTRDFATMPPEKQAKVLDYLKSQGYSGLKKGYLELLNRKSQTSSETEGASSQTMDGLETTRKFNSETNKGYEDYPRMVKFTENLYNKIKGELQKTGKKFEITDADGRGIDVKDLFRVEDISIRNSGATTDKKANSLRSKYGY